MTLIQKKCPKLKYLHVDQCSNLTSIEGGLLFTDPLFFEYLEELSAKNCIALRSLRLKAPNLKVLSLKKNENLEIVEFDMSQVVDVDLTDCPKVRLKINKQTALNCLRKDIRMLEHLSQDLQHDSDINSFGSIFGKISWERYLGKVSEEPPLSLDIHQTLEAPCPFWPDKKVRETHMLMLIPQTVNGKSLTPTYLGELVKRPKEGNKTQYSFFWDDEKTAYGDQGVSHSYWVLMTKDILPKTRNKRYDDQCQIIRDYSDKIAIPYEVPQFLEATTCIFLHYIRSGEPLYPPWTFTRCQKKTQSYQVCVGAFGLDGLVVSIAVYDDECIGLAGVRKL